MPYLAHFGLEEHPFTLTPDVEYFFPTEEHANIIESVEFALRRDTGIIKVVGDVGTGKTLLCRLLIKKLIDTEAVAYINAPRASANSILLGVCHEFGIEGADNPDTAYTALNRFLIDEHAKGRLAVVVVDEAQHLGREGLELVRLISNLETEKSKLLQIVLFGQTELDELLSDPSMRQLNQRIAFSLGTKPLDVNQSKAYINHRIRVSRRPGIEYDVFGARATEFLAKSCGGVPRVINIIADKSLLAAFADGAAVVQPKHVAEALKESGALVKPVTQNQRTAASWTMRTASYLGAAVALAVLAFAILALFPSSNVSHRLRSMWQAAGGLPTSGSRAPASADAPHTPPSPPASASPPAAGQAAATAAPAPIATPGPSPTQTSALETAAPATAVPAPTPAPPPPTKEATPANPAPTSAPAEAKSEPANTSVATAPAPDIATAPQSAPAPAPVSPPSAPPQAAAPQVTTGGPATIPAAATPIALSTGFLAAAAAIPNDKMLKPRHHAHVKSFAAARKPSSAHEPATSLSATSVTPATVAPSASQPTTGPTPGQIATIPVPSSGLSTH